MCERDWTCAGGIGLHGCVDWDRDSQGANSTGVFIILLSCL